AKPVLVPCPDADHQAAFVARRALELRERGINLNEMAVLYRSHFHALELQLELTRRNIPFSITSGPRFFEQAHIKDVAAYLKLVFNPRDEPAFKRLARLLPGIGDKGADKLWRMFASGLRVAGAEAGAAAGGPQPGTGNREPGTGVAAALQACATAVPAKAAAAWSQFSATVSQLEDESVRESPAKMIELALEAEYEDHLKKHFANYRS